MNRLAGIRTFLVENPKDGLSLANEALIKNSDKETVVFLSGGSTPKDLYEHLIKEARFIAGAVALVDERFGEKLHENSNMKMMKDTGLLDYLKKNKIPFYPILKSHKKSSILELTEDYGEKISSLFKDFSKHIAIMGIGEDGHTAGLPVGNKKTDSENQAYVTKIMNFPGEFNMRITLTFKALSQMDLLIILVFGSKKQSALQLMHEKGSFEEVPARFYIRPDIAPKTILITDRKV